jgi:hypothetical protein
MELTQQVRSLATEEAVKGMQDKAREFLDKGGEIYIRAQKTPETSS